MAYWKLEVIDAELEDEDREHIAELIKQGYIEGEIVQIVYFKAQE